MYSADKAGDELFVTYCDADHGGNKDNGKSTSGYVTLVCGGAVGWGSKLQSLLQLLMVERK